MSELNRQRVRTLRRLSTAWFRDQTVIARSDTVPGRAVLVRGSARDQESLRFLDKALMAGDLSLKEAEIYGDTERLAMAPMLWRQGQALSNPQAIGQATHGILVVNADLSFFEHLRLSKPTTKLIRGDHKPWESLSFILEKQGLALDRISRELGALVAMGMVRLRAPGRTGPPAKSPVVKRLNRQDPADRMLQAQMQRVLLQRRLEREWGQLQGLDDYTLLGVSSGADASILQAAAERMQRRYAKLSQKKGLSPTARDLAQKIKVRVDEAATRVLQGKAHNAAHMLLQSPEQAFEHGMKLAESREWSAAVTCLAVANRKLDNPEVQAWLGYAYFYDPRQPREQRQAKGREMLVLAESLGAPSATRLRMGLRSRGPRPE